MADDFLADLRRSIEAARRAGVDTRPLLLKSLVEHYVAQSRPDAPAQQRFTVLALRLFDAVDARTATSASALLAPHPATPYAVALHLAQAPIELAAPMLRQSPVLDEVTLMALAETSSAAHVAAIAARRDVPPTLAKRLAAATHDARSASRVEPAVVPPVPAPRLSLGPGDFLRASAAERALILDSLVALPPLPLSERAPRASHAALERLDQAAIRHQPESFRDGLQQALGVSEEIAGAIVADGSGEALIVACRALGMNFDAVSRILFFLNPAIGQSVTRVFGLADLFETLPDSSVHHLAAAWREGARRPAAGRKTEAPPSMRSFGGARRIAPGAAEEAGARRQRG
ncbi:DUF2336 domain-containing protein [Ancylobacter terrae]|uniref:DUF2336 domain-containing protein n=1 Tax=Ancylobacter sp. sgz301288 TaxID=3342077 RepID=UPI00385D175C